MPSTLLIAASDIFVMAGAAALATVALSSRRASFDTSLGTECDDDSLVVAETNEVVDEPELRSLPCQDQADEEKTEPIATVYEVAVTPPLSEEREDDYFVGAKAA